MIKEILLLASGGAITFAFTLLMNRFSRRKPSIVWRTLPPVHFPKAGLSAVQIIIANEGDAPATNVRTIVTLEKDGRFESVDVHPSEAALEYSCPSSAGPLELQLPRFPSQANVSLSCIVQSSKEPTPQISIVGDGDIIGAEAQLVSPERMHRMRTRAMKMYVAAYAFVILSVLLLASWFTAIGVEYRASQQQIVLGDLYFKNGDYESARRIYSEISSRWYEPPRFIAFVKLAAVAAAQDRNQAAIELLDQVPSDQWNHVQLLLSDPIFDSLRSQPDFKELLATKKD